MRQDAHCSSGRQVESLITENSVSGSIRDAGRTALDQSVSCFASNQIQLNNRLQPSQFDTAKPALPEKSAKDTGTGTKRPDRGGVVLAD